MNKKNKEEAKKERRRRRKGEKNKSKREKKNKNKKQEDQEQKRTKRTRIRPMSERKKDAARIMPLYPEDAFENLNTTTIFYPLGHIIMIWNTGTQALCFLLSWES